jgi:glycosyltransferase involved in cell wall biosynthesis
MRIAMFTQWWPPEPAGVVGALGADLAKRGHQVDVVTGFPNYPSGRIHDGYALRWRQVEEKAGIRVVRVPLYPSHDRSAIRRIANYLSFAASAATVGVTSLRDVDVAYVYHPPITSVLPAVLLKTLKRTPFVLHIQDLWPESVVHAGMLGDGAAKRFVESILDRVCMGAYRSAAHIVVLSPGFKRILVARGVPEEKISVVYNWTDEGVNYPSESDPGIRARLGQLDRRIVLYAGNIGHYQNLDAAVRAAASVAHDTNIDFVLMGDGVARPDLERLITDLGATNVRRMDAVPPSEVAQFQAAADVLLVSLKDLPFFSATIPGKTQGAMASGKPVMMAVQGDAADLIRDAGAGFVADPTEAGMRAAFQSIANLSEEGLRLMGARARCYYVEKLSLNVGVDRVAKAMREIGLDR